MAVDSGLPPLSSVTPAHKAGGLKPLDRPGGDPLRRAAAELSSLAGVRTSAEPVRVAQADPGGLPGLWEATPEPAQAEATPLKDDRSIGREFVDSFLHTLGPQNIETVRRRHEVDGSTASA